MIGFKSVAVVCLLAVLSGCGNITGRIEWQNDEVSAPSSSNMRTEPMSAEALRKRAALIIQSPAASLNSAAARCEVFGTFDEIPNGCYVYVLLESPYGFFAQWPPARLDPAKKTFGQRNVRIGPEISSLHVVLVEAPSARAFENRAAQNDWSAIASLPEGVIICDTVEIH
jgi:hypothetical protein